MWPFNRKKENQDQTTFLILGHPRSGTGFISKLFETNGLDIGHELWNRNGTSNWVFAVDDETGFPWVEHPRGHYSWDKMIHVIRDPYKAVPSIWMTETPSSNPDNEFLVASEQLRRKYVDFPDTNELENAAASYLGWNKIIGEQNPDHTVRVEHAMADLEGLSSISKEFENTAYNSRKKSDSKPFDQWHLLSQDYLDKLDAFCEANGYQKLSERI